MFEDIQRRFLRAKAARSQSIEDFVDGVVERMTGRPRPNRGPWSIPSWVIEALDSLGARSTSPGAPKAGRGVEAVVSFLLQAASEGRILYNVPNYEEIVEENTRAMCAAGWEPASAEDRDLAIELLVATPFLKYQITGEERPYAIYEPPEVIRRNIEWRRTVVDQEGADRRVLYFVHRQLGNALVTILWENFRKMPSARLEIGFLLPARHQWIGEEIIGMPAFKEIYATGEYATRETPRGRLLNARTRIRGRDGTESNVTCIVADPTGSFAPHAQPGLCPVRVTTEIEIRML